MPEVNKIISVNVDDIDDYGEIDTHIDVTIDEFLDACYIDDMQELLRYAERNFPELFKTYSVIENTHASESFYEEAVNKLHSNWNRLTKEQEDTILNIANKL